MTIRKGTHNTDQFWHVYYCDNPHCDESTVSEWANGWLTVEHGIRVNYFSGNGHHFCRMACLTMWAGYMCMGGVPSKEVVLWTPKILNLRLWWQLSRAVGGGPFTDPLALMLCTVEVVITSRGGGLCRLTRSALMLERARVVGA